MNMKPYRRAFLAALLVTSALSAASGQQIRYLPRATSTTGLNDSALVAVVDSAQRTRAGTIAQMRKAYSVKAFDSLVTTKMTLTGATITGKPSFTSAWTSTGRDSLLAGSALAFAVNDTVYGSPIWNASQTFGTITVSSCTGCSGASFPLLATNGTAAAPSYSFTNSTGLGLYRFGADTLGISAAGRFAVAVSDSQFRAVSGRAGKPSLAFDVDGTTGLYYSGAGLRIAAGGVARMDVSGSIVSIQTANTTFRLQTGLGASTPDLAWAANAGLGLYRVGADTLGIATGGVHSLRISGGAAPTIAGGAGNMTLLAGTGASRTLALQVSDASSIARTAVTLNANQSVNFDTLVTVQDGSGNNTISLIPTGGSATINLRQNGPPVLTHALTVASDSTLRYQGTGSSTRFSVHAGTGTASVGDTLYISSVIAGSNAASSISGGAGNMTVTAGTGASRTMTLRTTTSGSAAKNTLVLGADSSTTFLGKIVPNSLLGVIGTVTNDNANAGSVGEYVSGSRATGSSLTLTTATSLTVDSISLTAGDWDVSGVVAYTYGATTSVTNQQGGISTTTNVLGGLGNNFDAEHAAEVMTATNDPVLPTPVVRISVASTTTVFLVAQTTFTVSTAKGYGAMRARRVR